MGITLTLQKDFEEDLLDTGSEIYIKYKNSFTQKVTKKSLGDISPNQFPIQYALLYDVS